MRYYISGTISKALPFLLVGIIAFAGGVYFSDYFPLADMQIGSSGACILHRDTVVRVIKAEPIVITKIRPRIIYRRDTVYSTRPFLARIDTIYMKDTINLSYMFPEHSMSLAIRPAPRLERTHILTLSPGMDKSNFLENVTWAGSGLALGILIGAVVIR